MPIIVIVHSKIDDGEVATEPHRYINRTQIDIEKYWGNLYM